MPFETKVKVNGFVSVIISGAHNVQIFAPGTSFEQLRSMNPIPTLPIGPGIVDIPTNRIYRGLDPIALGPVQDRIETVQFQMPGRHLVICGLLPHFLDNMHGFVRVVGNGFMLLNCSKLVPGANICTLCAPLMMKLTNPFTLTFVSNGISW
jgi:hypothetical protein